MRKHIKIPNNLFEVTRTLLKDDSCADEITLFWLHVWTECNLKTKDGWPYFEVRGVEMTNKNIIIMFRMERYPSVFVGESIEKLEASGLMKRDANRLIVMPPWLKKRDRNTPEYKAWRFMVMQRDGFKCSNCGSINKLVAHHIVHWSDTEADDPIRFDLANGITLCHECHLKAHGGRWK